MTDGASNYRGTIRYHLFLEPPLSQPLYVFTFEQPVDDITLQFTFTGYYYDFLFFEVNHTNFRYIAQDPSGQGYGDTILMPPELWSSPTHDISFGVRGNGYVDLWLDYWKMATIRDPDFDDANILHLDTSIDVFSKSNAQTAVFTEYQFASGYEYTETPPVITSLDNDASVDEGPDPALVGLTAYFEDAEGWDKFTATIDWGDGHTDNVPWEDFVFTPDGYPSLSGSGSVTASHVYPDDGTYSGSITITDIEGGSDSESFMVDVYEVPPTVDFHWSAVETIDGYNVTLTPDVIVDPDGLDRHEWRKDGESSAFAVTYDDSPVTLPFSDIAEHDITLTSYDGDGSYASLTKRVKPLFPVAEVRSITPSNPNEGEQVTIMVGLKDDLFEIKSVKWIIDGVHKNSQGTSITHTFSDDGTYEFTATIRTVDGSSASITDTITVLDVPTMVTITSPTPPVSIDIGYELLVTWHITDPGADGPWSYIWKDNFDSTQIDYNNLGTITTGVSYTSKLLLVNAGITSMTLKVTDNKGVTYTATIPVSINTAPALTLTGPTTVNVNHPAQFTAEILSPGIGYVTQITWDIGGITSSSVPNNNLVTKTVSFSTPGTYTASATITTQFGESATESIEFSVVEIPEPETPLELKNAAHSKLEETRDAMNAELESLGKKSKKILKAFDSALDYIEASTNPDYWAEDGNLLQTKKGKKVFDAEKHAVDKIRGLVKFWEKEQLGGTLPEDWNSVIDILVEADRLIAENELADAWTLVGPDPSKKVSKHLDKSQEFIDKAADTDKPSRAIELYKKAWDHSQDAKKLLK